MKKKKSIVILVAITLIGIIAIYTIYNLKRKSNQITVIAYKESENSYEDNIVEEELYTITKYEDINSIGWISKNELLTMTDKKNSQTGEQILSIYNLETKEFKDYENVNMDKDSFYGISKTGKHVLYGETLDTSKDGFYQTIKILNLESEEITELNVEDVNWNAEYRWISDDKIFVLFNNSNNVWKVININGQVVEEGNIEYINGNTGSSIVSTEDINDLGEKIEGKFYFTKYYVEENGSSLGKKIYSIDVNSKNEESFDKLQGSDYVQKCGDSFFLEYYNNNGKAINGLYLNRTFGFNIFDSGGNILQNKELELGKKLTAQSLSTHGSRLAYAEGLNYVNNINTSTSELNKNLKVNIMNIKSGETKEVANVDSLSEKNLGDNVFLSVSNFVWNESETSLIFTCNYYKREVGSTALTLIKTNSYIVESEI